MATTTVRCYPPRMGRLIQNNLDFESHAGTTSTKQVGGTGRQSKLVVPGNLIYAPTWWLGRKRRGTLSAALLGICEGLLWSPCEGAVSDPGNVGTVLEKLKSIRPPAL
ncbi:hypothetical protein R3P38DRAFT_2808207 [Favolaschia claudopus]|uniref:Uncharacterized protein n=1 Tax=Favolaschia claudopus TaxID=2862362 RepID=A0AAV9ZHT5_9AGAR